jgi:glycoside/pentoside/hexuronide:cation symporter, GPH family
MESVSDMQLDTNRIATVGIPLKRKLGYGIGDFGTNISFQSVNFFLLYFLTRVALMPPATAGLALMLGKLWDGVTDPLVGLASDRTRSRFGRRRFYFLTSAVPFGLTFALLWFIPNLSDAGRFVYVTVAYLLYSTCMTLFNVPYTALTPELSPDYNERTSITGFRMAFAILGTLIGAGLTGVVVGIPANLNQGYQLMGGIFGLTIIISCLICFVLTDGCDRTPPQKRRISLKEYISVFQNKPFVFLLLMYCGSTFAVTVISANLKFFINDVMKLTGTLGEVPLGLLLLVAMASLPLWTWLTRQIGKKNCHIIGLSTLALCSLLIAYSATASLIWFFALVVVAGIAVATHFLCNWAMIPDCIEVDELITGHRREGIYYGIWFLGQKVFMALAIWGNGIVLSYVKYQIPATPDELIVQPSTVLSGIRFLAGPLPAIVIILSLVALSFYPITEKKFAEIKQQLQEKSISDRCTDTAA